MAPKHPDEVRMTLGEHLEELRTRLFVGLIGPLVAAIVMLVFGKHIVAFLAQPALVAMEQNDLPPRMINPNFISAFAVYLKVSLMGGLIVGIPWLVWQLWLFIGPGLYQTEQRIVKILIPASTGLMVTGVVFLYYVMLPIMLWFLLNFAVGFPMPELDRTAMQRRIDSQVTEERKGDENANGNGEVTAALPEPINIPRLWEDPQNPEIGDIWVNLAARELRIMAEDGLIWHTRLSLARTSMMEPLIQIDDYIGLVMIMGLAFSLAFQLPLVMLVLGKVGIISYSQMAGSRKYAALIIVVVCAMATPPDPFSQVGLAVPLYLLYEVGLLLVKWFGPPPEEAWD